jgi:hypothetical protein
MLTSVVHWAVMSSYLATAEVELCRQSNELAPVVPAHSGMNHLPLAAILLLVEVE